MFQYNFYKFPIDILSFASRSNFAKRKRCNHYTELRNPPFLHQTKAHQFNLYISSPS